MPPDETRQSLPDRSALDVPAVLRAARALLADEKKWTQGASARDARGTDLYEAMLDAGEDAARAALHPEATCWCLGGALDRVSGSNINCDDGRFAVLWDLMDSYVGMWNDTHTHAEVLAVLDEAIERAVAFDETRRYACGVDADAEVTCEHCPDPDGCIDGSEGASRDSHPTPEEGR